MVMNRVKPLWVGSISLTILLFLLSACSTTTGIQIPSAQAGAGATVQEDQIAQAVFQAINQSRAQSGLAPLTWSIALANSARQHAIWLCKQQTLCPTNCLEKQPWAIAKGNRVSTGHGRQRTLEQPAIKPSMGRWVCIKP